MAIIRQIRAFVAVSLVIVLASLSGAGQPKDAEASAAQLIAAQLMEKCLSVDSARGSAEREQAGKSLIGYVEGKDPRLVFDATSDFPPSELVGLIRARVLRTLAIREPEQAAARIGRLTSSTVRLALVSYLASVWARQDLKAAAQWAESLIEPDERKTAVFNVAVEATTSDKVLAVRLISQLPDVEAVVQLKRQLASQPAHAGP